MHRRPSLQRGRDRGHNYSDAGTRLIRIEKALNTGAGSLGSERACEEALLTGPTRQFNRNPAWRLVRGFDALCGIAASRPPSCAAALWSRLRPARRGDGTRPWA